MNAEAEVDALVARLRVDATPERAEKEKAYLKSDLEFLGATVPATRKACRALQGDHPELGHDGLMALVDEAWGRGILELRMAAVELLELYADRLTPDDVPTIERLIRASKTWALVDGLAASVTGGLVDRFPEPMHPILERWAGDDDFWVRRASLLAYLPGLRRGEGHFERFTALADPMLEETEPFIRKAIGWVLRETGKKQPERVVAWLEPRARRASGLTVREAAKRLPEADRDRLLAARERG